MLYLTFGHYVGKKSVTLKSLRDFRPSTISHTKKNEPFKFA